MVLLIFLCFLFSLVVIGSTVLLVRQALRWSRSHTLNWPGELSGQEQARICRKYFMRSGINVIETPADLFHFHLTLSELPNTVLISFRPSQEAVLHSYMNDLKQSLLSRKHKMTIVVVVRGAVNAGMLRWTNEFEIALLPQGNLPRLASLLLSKSKNLREELFRVSLGELEPRVSVAAPVAVEAPT